MIVAFKMLQKKFIFYYQSVMRGYPDFFKRGYRPGRNDE
jgi:hypothetical protein